MEEGRQILTTVVYATRWDMNTEWGGGKSRRVSASR